MHCTKQRKEDKAGLTGIPEHLLLLGKVVKRRRGIDLWPRIRLFHLGPPHRRAVQLPVQLGPRWGRIVLTVGGGDGGAGMGGQGTTWEGGERSDEEAG